jgi:hypothetical protein
LATTTSHAIIHVLVHHLSSILLGLRLVATRSNHIGLAGKLDSPTLLDVKRLQSHLISRLLDCHWLLLIAWWRGQLRRVHHGRIPIVKGVILATHVRVASSPVILTGSPVDLAELSLDKVVHVLLLGAELH